VVQQRLVHCHVATPRHFDAVGPALWIEKLVVNRHAPILTADTKRSFTKFSAGPRAGCPKPPHGNRAWGISHLANTVAIEKPRNSLVACSTATPHGALTIVPLYIYINEDQDAYVNPGAEFQRHEAIYGVCSGAAAKS
jgi:hypothetical protein